MLNARLLIKVAIGVAISAGSLIVVAQIADLPGAVARILAVEPQLLAIPIIVVLVQFCLRSVRWGALLSAITGARVSAIAVAGPLAAGYLGNTVLPVRLGEVVRIVLVARRTPAGAAAATASVVVERAIDLTALLTVAAAASWISGMTSWLALAGAVGLLIAISLILPVAGGAAARLPARVPVRLRGILDRFLRAFAAVKPMVVAQAWVLSLLAWGCDSVLFWLCAQALGVPIDPGTAVLIATGAAVGAALPAAAGYLGTYELGAMAMAAFAGVPADAALQITLLAHAIAVLPLAALGLGALGLMAVVPAARATEEGGVATRIS